MSKEQKDAPVEEAIIVEAPQQQALALITKAEIDVQISTAKAFPRSVTAFVRKVMSVATISADVAESCFYALPRAGKTIEGPSVRLAEIVAASYGNLRTGARVVYMDEKKVVAQGIVHDLENNIYHAEEVERSLLQHVWEDDPNRPGKKRKTGRMVTVNEDMKIVIGRAACAVAYRNAMFKVVPAALVKDVEAKIKEVAKGDAQTLPTRRKQRVEYLHSIGVKDPQICEVLEVKHIDDIDLEKLQVLQGFINAIKNEGVDVGSIFPEQTPKDKANGANKAAEDKIKKKSEGKKDPQQELEDKLKQQQGAGDQGAQ